jgi:hypothetical protein
MKGIDFLSNERGVVLDKPKQARAASVRRKPLAHHSAITLEST